MVFDEDQAKGQAGRQPVDEDESQEQDPRPDRERQRGAGSTAAAAGAAGTGLGVGAGAGVVGAGEALDHLTDGEGDAEDLDLSGIEGARERVQAAEEAARAATAATYDVFESRVEGVDVDLPDGVTDASLILGDAVPPIAEDDGPDTGQPPGGGPPPANRPQPEDSVPLDDGPPVPGAPSAPDGFESPDDIPEVSSEPGAPEGPGAPEPPAFPGAPSFPGPPPGGPSGAPGEDEVIGEAPAPPGEPSLDPPSGPAPAGPGEGTEPAPPPEASGPTEDPPVGGIPDAPASPSAPDGPGEPIQGETAPPSSPDTPDASAPSDGPSSDPADDSAPPIGSAPDSPSAPESPTLPGSPDDPAPPVGSEPSSPGSPVGSEEPSSPTPPSSGGDDPGSAGPAPDPGSGSATPATYPYISDWNVDGGWVDVMTRNDHGDILHFRYDTDGSVYYIDDHGNYHPVDAEHLPTLLYVDGYGKGYFSVPHNGDTAYFSLDTHGERDWLHEYEIPGYDVPDDEYEYPRVVQWDADAGWAIVDDGEGHYTQYYEDGRPARFLDEHGNEVLPNGQAQYGELLYVDNNGNAYFRNGEEGDYNYFMIDHDGGIEYVDYTDVPGYEPEEPDYGDHPPYFLDDYANPFYGDLEPDGEPIFANGFYTQIYNDGQVVVSYQQEGGPYRIRWISEDANGQDYIALDITYDATNYEYDVHAYPYDYFDHVTEDFTVPEVDHYVDYAYLGIPPDSVEIAGHQVYYTWYDEDGDVSQRTRVNRDTGEVSYQYDGVVIYVDANGNQSYTGTPDPDWTVPDGYAPTEDLHPPYGMPPYMEFGDQQYFDPEGAGYELISAVPEDDPTQWQYIGPNGERVIINKTDEHTYQFVYQPDPNAPPGQWEMVMDITTDEYGNYVSYEAVDGTYYDEWYEDNPQYDAQYVYDLLPDNLPAEFNGGYYNPEHGGGYEYHHSAEYGASPAHFFSHADGKTVAVVENSNGTISMYWYDRPVEEFGPLDINDLEAHAFISPDGNYNVEYYEDGVEVDPPPADDEEYYEADWAAHYQAHYGYEHPYDQYGQPDEPGENQAPNVYLFGGGRAMVVRNPDGSETITWYSEGGYTDGYIEYKATVAYDGGQWVTESLALPVDLIPNYGILPVDGTPIYDPYHPDAPWGEPDSVTILEDRVIAIWETDEGQLRSEWYRDGSHYREVRYPDGLVISGNGSDPWNYDVPEGWQAPDYDGAEPLEFEADGYLPEGAPDYFGEEIWTNPETDERFEFQFQGNPEPGTVTRTYRADLDGDGTHDYQIVVIESADGTISVDYRNLETGENEARVNVAQDTYGNYNEYFELQRYVDDPQGVPPVEAEPEPLGGTLPEGTPDSFEFGGRVFENPVTAFGEPVNIVTYDHGNHVTYWYEDPATGERYLVNFGADGTALIGFNYEGATPELIMEIQVDENGAYSGHEYVGGSYWHEYNDQVDEAEELNEQDDYDPLPDWLPNSFDGYPSPTQEGFEYQYTGTGDGNQNHYYTNGQYTIMVTDYGDGTGRVLIDDLSNGQGWDTGYDLHDYGQYTIMDTYAPEEPEAAADDDYLPDWLPYSFDGYPSPVQEGFEYQYTGTGGGYENHFYTNGQYTIMVTDYGNGTGRVLIDDLSNGQGWDTGYDLHDYGQYTLMDEYAGEMQTQAMFVENVEELDEEEAAEIAELRADEETEPGEVVETEGSPEEVSEIEADGGIAEVVEEDLQFDEETAGDTEPEETAEPLSFEGPEAESEAVAEEVAAVIEEDLSDESGEVEIVTEFAPQPQPALVEEESLVGEPDEADALDDDDLDDGTGF